MEKYSIPNKTCAENFKDWGGCWRVSFDNSFRDLRRGSRYNAAVETIVEKYISSSPAKRHIWENSRDIDGRNPIPNHLTYIKPYKF